MSSSWKKKEIWETPADWRRPGRYDECSSQPPRWSPRGPGSPGIGVTCDQQVIVGMTLISEASPERHCNLNLAFSGRSRLHVVRPFRQQSGETPVRGTEAPCRYVTLTAGSPVLRGQVTAGLADVMNATSPETLSQIYLKQLPHSWPTETTR